MGGGRRKLRDFKKMFLLCLAVLFPDSEEDKECKEKLLRPHLPLPGEIL